jgi:hypothetical protein
MKMNEQQRRWLYEHFHGTPKPNDTIEQILDKITVLGQSAKEEREVLKGQMATETDPVATVLLMIRLRACNQTYLDVYDLLNDLMEMAKETKAA